MFPRGQSKSLKNFNDQILKAWSAVIDLYHFVNNFFHNHEEFNKEFFAQYFSLFF